MRKASRIVRAAASGTAALTLIACVSGTSASPASASFDMAQRSPPRALPPMIVAEPRQPSFAQRVLAAHNRYRAEAGVPPLTWDPALAAGAAAYGPALAASGQLVHSPRATRPGIAENLWMGTAWAYTPEAMVGSWGAERAQFRAGIFPAVSTTGNWLDVAHYTQMIWRGTTRVGCALHRERMQDYLICRYSPSGNRDGQRVP